MTKQELQKAFDQTFVSDYLRCRSCDDSNIASCVPHNCPQDLLCPCGKIREAYDCQDEKWITDGPRNGDRDARVVPDIAKLCRGTSVPLTPIRSYAAWCIERFLKQVEGMQIDGDVRYRAERILDALNGADDLLAAYDEAAQVMLTSSFGRKAVERFLVGLSCGALAVATGLRTGSVYTDSHQLDLVRLIAREKLEAELLRGKTKTQADKALTAQGGAIAQRVAEIALIEKAALVAQRKAMGCPWPEDAEC